MEPHASPANVLSALLQEHRALEKRIRRMARTPPQVLRAGRTLLEFARHEDQAFATLARWLDPAVLDEMGAEHSQISLDLELLEWLQATTPDSPDAAVL